MSPARCRIPKGKLDLVDDDARMNGLEADSLPTAEVDGIVRGFRERRRRGTRVALDWRYSLKRYLAVPTIIVFGFLGGLDLLGQHSRWQQALGVLLLIATVLIMGVLGRWLLRPVDPLSRDKLHRRHKEMRSTNL